MKALPLGHVLVGDAARQLQRLQPQSVDCVITSPPYFSLRDYNVAGQYGLEGNVGQWVDELRLVCRGLARVLKPTGGLWLNLGDAYSRHARTGAPAKSLLLAPERLLLALSTDGWICRSKVIWSKQNPMPESVSDRLSTTYDVVYFLVRSPRYYFDLNSIRQPVDLSHTQTPTSALTVDSGLFVGKNPGDVWRLPIANYRGAHFATFPEALVERPLLANCPEALCISCDRPWRRAETINRVTLTTERAPRRGNRLVKHYPTQWRTYRRLSGLASDCRCNAGTRPGVVLDPFLGSGTTAVVAERLGRDWVGIELNRDYAELAERRIAAARPTTRAGPDALAA